MPAHVTMPDELAELARWCAHEDLSENAQCGDPPSEDGAPLAPYRAGALDRWGIEPERTGVETLGVEDDADAWLGSEHPLSDRLQRPGTIT